MIKLIATDIDGTLIREGSSALPEEIFDLIRELRKRNLYFAAASGRQYMGLKRLFSPVADQMLFISENGSNVVWKDEELYASVIDPELVKIARVEEMLHELLGMISLAQEAFEKESSEIASRIFLKDNIIDEINHDSTPLIAQYIEAHPGSALAGLYMAGVIRKMERFGDHCTNIAEELIFYLDAKVMKHIGKTEEK